MSRKNTVKPRQNNRFRIVAGEWRGRRLPFADGATLRPTPDRVRETVFNWLAPRIAGARCLDLFAGSGALGLEALSRGAASVLFVDNDPKSIATISQNLTLLACSDGQVRRADGRAVLRGPANPFDIVFLDPPFNCGWLPQLCTLLADRGWLSAQARVYVEYRRGEQPQWPEGYLTDRSANAGQVAYALLSYND